MDVYMYGFFYEVRDTLKLAAYVYVYVYTLVYVYLTAELGIKT